MIIVASYLASDFLCATMSSHHEVNSTKCIWIPKNILEWNDIQIVPVNQDEIWIDAAKNGNSKVIEHLLWSNNQNLFSRPPPTKSLDEAARFGHMDIVRMLVQHGLRSFDAVIFASSRGHLDIVQYLVSQNLYDEKHALTGSPWTAVYIANDNEYAEIEAYLRSVNEHYRLF